jgi:mannose-6-phosphate isomerase class I
MSRKPIGLDARVSEEHRRELLVRSVRCPVCLVAPGKTCRFEKGTSVTVRAHTGRYNVAAEQGLVPPLPKVSS